MAPSALVFGGSPSSSKAKRCWPAAAPAIGEGTGSAQSGVGPSANRSTAPEGAATSTEITDALASLTRAQQNYLNARYSYLIAVDRLNYAMGVVSVPTGQVSRHH